MSTTIAKRGRATLDMTKGSLLKNLIVFAVPLALTSLLQLLFNATDIIVVGQFVDSSIATNAVASIGASTPIVNLLVNFFMGLSVGATVLIAKYFGAKREQDLSQTIHTSIVISLVAGIILTVIGVLFAEQILVLMNTPKNILPLASKYLRIYFAGNVVTMLYNFGSAILRAVGDTKRPLIFLAVSGVANIGFNLFFVLVCNMDVEGVALGTLISQAISAVLIIWCLVKEKGAHRLEFKKLRVHRDKLLKILHLGVPAGIQSSLFSLSNIFLQSGVNSFGEITVAGNSAGSNIEGFVYACMNSFHHASLSCVGQNLGAGDYNRIKKTLILSPLCSVVVGLFLCGLVLIFREQLLGLYLTNPLAISKGVERIFAIIPVYFLCGVMDAISGVIRGAGFSIYPTVVNLLGVCVFRIVWLNTVFMNALHTIPGLFLCYPISWGLVIVALLAFYFVKAKKSILSQCETNRQYHLHHE